MAVAVVAVLAPSALLSPALTGDNGRLAFLIALQVLLAHGRKIEMVDSSPKR